MNDSALSPGNLAAHNNDTEGADPGHIAEMHAPVEITAGEASAISLVGGPADAIS